MWRPQYFKTVGPKKCHTCQHTLYSLHWQFQQLWDNGTESCQTNDFKVSIIHIANQDGIFRSIGQDRGTVPLIILWKERLSCKGSSSVDINSNFSCPPQRWSFVDSTLKENIKLYLITLFTNTATLTLKTSTPKMSPLLKGTPVIMSYVVIIMSYVFITNLYAFPLQQMAH